MHVASVLRFSDPGGRGVIGLWSPFSSSVAARELWIESFVRSRIRCFAWKSRLLIQNHTYVCIDIYEISILKIHVYMYI